MTTTWVPERTIACTECAKPEPGMHTHAESSYEGPVRFDGTATERAANHATHRWFYDGDTDVCEECCAKTWHVTATWPCGHDVRERIVTIHPVFERIVTSPAKP